jgi:hypothetical protein
MGGICPTPLVRSGIWTVIEHCQRRGKCGMTQRVKERSTLAACQPPPSSLPSSGRMVRKWKSLGVKVTTGSGCGASSVGSGERVGGVMAEAGGTVGSGSAAD